MPPQDDPFAGLAPPKGAGSITAAGESWADRYRRSRPGVRRPTSDLGEAERMAPMPADRLIGLEDLDATAGILRGADILGRAIELPFTAAIEGAEAGFRKTTGSPLFGSWAVLPNMERTKSLFDLDNAPISPPGAQELLTGLTLFAADPAVISSATTRARGAMSILRGASAENPAAHAEALAEYAKAINAGRIAEEKRVLDALATDRGIASAIDAMEAQRVRVAADAATPALEGMTRGELDAAWEAARSGEKSAAVDVFGPQGAAEYERLQRQANSFINPDKAKAASARIEEMESALTPQQQDHLFGVGGHGAEDIGRFRDELASIDAGGTVEDLGQAVADTLGKSDDAIVRARVREIERIAAERGIDPEAVRKAAGVAAMAKYGEDAPMMVDSLFDAAKGASPPKPPLGTPPKSLGAAGAAPMTDIEADLLKKPFEAMAAAAPKAWEAIAAQGDIAKRAYGWAFLGDAERVTRDLGRMEAAQSAIRDLGNTRGSVVSGNLAAKLKQAGATADEIDLLTRHMFDAVDVPASAVRKEVMDAATPVLEQLKKWQQTADEMNMAAGRLSPEAIRERGLKGGIYLPRVMRVRMEELAAEGRHAATGGSLPSSHFSQDAHWTVIKADEATVHKLMADTRTAGNELYAHEARTGETLVKFRNEADVVALNEAAEKAGHTIKDTGPPLTEAERIAYGEARSPAELAAVALVKQYKEAGRGLFFRGVGEKYGRFFPAEAKVPDGWVLVDKMADEVHGFNPESLGPYLQGKHVPKDVYELVRGMVEGEGVLDARTRGMVSAWKALKIRTPSGIGKQWYYDLGEGAIRLGVEPWGRKNMALWREALSDINTMTGEYSGLAGKIGSRAPVAAGERAVPEELNLFLRHRRGGFDLTKKDIELANRTLGKLVDDTRGVSEFEKGKALAETLTASFLTDSPLRATASGTAHGAIRGAVEGIPLGNIPGGFVGGAIRGAAEGGANLVLNKFAKDFLEAHYDLPDKLLAYTAFKKWYRTRLEQLISEKGPAVGRALEEIKNEAALWAVTEKLEPLSQFSKAPGELINIWRGTGKMDRVGLTHGTASLVGRVGGQPWASWQAELVRTRTNGLRMNPLREIYAQSPSAVLRLAGAASAIALGGYTIEQMKEFFSKHPMSVPYPDPFSDSGVSMVGLDGVTPADPATYFTIGDDPMGGIVTDALSGGFGWNIAAPILRGAAYSATGERKTTRGPDDFGARKGEEPAEYAVRQAQDFLRSPLFGSQARALERDVYLARGAGKRFDPGAEDVPPMPSNMSGDEVSPVRRLVSIATGIKTKPYNPESDTRKGIINYGMEFESIARQLQDGLGSREISKSRGDSGAFIDARARSKAALAVSRATSLLGDLRSKAWPLSKPDERMVRALEQFIQNMNRLAGKE